MDEIDETLERLAGWNAFVVAEAAGLHPQTVRNIRCRRHAPNWATLRKLRQAADKLNQRKEQK